MVIALARPASIGDETAMAEPRDPLQKPRRFGLVRISGCWRERPSLDLRSCGRGRGRPRLMGLGPETAEGRAADQVRLGVEDVMHCGVGGEELLWADPCDLNFCCFRSPPPF